MGYRCYALAFHSGLWRKGVPGSRPIYEQKLSSEAIRLALLHHNEQDQSILANASFLLGGDMLAFRKNAEVNFHSQFHKEAFLLKRVLSGESGDDTCFYSDIPNSCFIYPAPKRIFLDSMAQFLREPVGKVWLAYGRMLSSARATPLIPSVDGPHIGPTVLPFEDTLFLSEIVWQVSTDTQSRFDLLWNTNFWAKRENDPWQHQWISDLSYNKFALFIENAPVYHVFDASTPPPYWIDKAAALSALAGLTDLSSSELVLLTMAAFQPNEYYYQQPTPRARRISALLVLDMLARMSSDERRTVEELLIQTRKFWRGRRNAPILKLHLVLPDTEIWFPDPPDSINHKELFELWMLARAQLGLPVVRMNELTVDRYLSLTSTERR